MKRILLIMTIAFISISAKAQDITISGITFGATKNDVIKILNEKKYQYQNEDKIFLVSPYTNKLSTAINKMYIILNSDNIVNEIALVIDADIRIFDNYDYIVSKLKEKYGNPTIVVEKYYSPYSENYRDYPLSAIEYVNKHGTTWKVNNLKLITSLGKVGILVDYLDTRYQDKETTNDY
jgi:hypothetical protein